MARRRLQWFGSEVKRKMRSAQILGVNKTMSECVIHAKSHHEFRNRTTTLEGSIRIVAFATPISGGVRGVWGSADVVHARRIEEGFHGTDKAGRKVSQRAYPYLRPAADARYPELAKHINEAFEAAK